MATLSWRRPRRWLWLALALVGAALVYALGRALPITLIDFEHYLAAARLLWQRQSPYGAIEFFAPPWMALLLAPLLGLSARAATAAWVLLLTAAMGGAALLAAVWVDWPRGPRARQLVPLLALLAPPALFVLITGQVTGVVGPAALLAAYLIATERAQQAAWSTAAALWVSLLKPHSVLLLSGLCGLELLRRRAWRPLAGLAGLTALGALFGFLVLPDWPAELWRAWRGGAYLGGPGLAAAGYQGLGDLGVPGWVWLPLAGYVLLAAWRRGLNAYTAALALPAGLLLVGYHRGYDQVVLLLPALFVLARRGEAGTTARRRWAAPGLVLAALGAPLLGLSVAVPLLIAAAVLLAGDAPESKTAPASGRRAA